MSSLYELTNEFMEIASQLDEMGLDQETIQDTLESLQIPLVEKAENIIKFAKNMEALAEVRKNEAKRLNELAAKDLKKAESLLTYLDENLQKAGIKKMSAGPFQMSYRKGTEVVVVDESRLPKEYWVQQEPKPLSKTELKKLVKEQEIEGVSLVRNPDSLQIK